ATSRLILRYLNKIQNKKYENNKPPKIKNIWSLKKLYYKLKKVSFNYKVFNFNVIYKKINSYNRKKNYNKI
ncbi:hypothetical protein ACMBCN_02125, partial [Candidatus Liberibacter asiaticus]|nr:hypothetical protein [Candidatus Liberibacter asiaticus]